MGLFSFFSKAKEFDDDDLSLTAERAVREHPILKDVTNISAHSENGVVQILGRVKSKSYKNRITKTIKSKFKRSNRNYKSIKNMLEVDES